MDEANTRWLEKFDSYERSLTFLHKYIEKDQLNDMESLGSIHMFKVTFNIAEQLLREHAKAQNFLDLHSPTDTIHAAWELGLIHQLDDWTEMLNAHQQTNETYRTEIAGKIAADIQEKFFSLLVSLRRSLQTSQNSL